LFTICCLEETNVKRRHIPIAGLLAALLVAFLGQWLPETTTPLPAALLPEERQALQNRLSQLPLYFVENQGQLDEQVVYYLQGADTAVYFTATAVTIAQTAPPPAEGKSFALRQPGRAWAEAAPLERQRWSVRLEFLGADQDVRPIGEGQTEAIISYFKGQPQEWHTSLPTFSRVVYPELWPGIDLVYEGSAGRLKYSFVVRPGADPAQIQLAYRGATEVTVNAAGQMEVKTPVGGFTDDIPVAYQETGSDRVAVTMAYRLDETTNQAEMGTFGFLIGDYNAALPLILDPVVLLYGGYLGGSNSDSGNSIAVDGAGNVYVTGYTYSTEDSFPLLAGPDLVFNGGADAFVAKVSSDGASLLYAGYIGGSSDDFGHGIAVDGSGNAYVTGLTSSTEATFPVLEGPNLTYNGDFDAFVAKVSSSGASLLYAGYIGGSGFDSARGIAVDGSGNAYVTGFTNSTEGTFPVLAGPDLTHNGGVDAFVAKVSSSGASLLFAGYIGGTGADYGYGIAVDGLGNAYVTGNTTSTEASFPVVGGPDLTYNGGSDAFVVKVVADDMPPASSASSPAYANTVPISVSWSAGDDNSGVNSTTLWVKYGSGGAWNATDLSQPGHSGIFDYIPAAGDGAYYFATVATDYAGNIEPAPIGSGDDATIYDTAAPSSLASAPAHAAAAPISVDWNAEDATSGVDSVALWVKYGHGGSWVKAGLSQFGQSGVFHYVPTSGGGTYYFATVATDHAGNVEANPIGLGHTATVYEPATALFLPVVLRK
jgi:hypothetical protein